MACPPRGGRRQTQDPAGTGLGSQQEGWAAAARRGQRHLPGWPGVPPAGPGATGAARVTSTRRKRQQAVLRATRAGGTARQRRERAPQSSGTTTTAESSAQGTKSIKAGAGGVTDFLAQAPARGWPPLCGLSHGGHEDLDEHSFLLAGEGCGGTALAQHTLASPETGHS